MSVQQVVAATPDEMRRVGAALAAVLGPGDTVLLGGELGAGKTTLVQGLARALGVTEPVTSPTFVLVHEYPTEPGWELLHADVWRLEQLREVVDLAIPERLEEGAAVVVEWGQTAAPALPRDCLEVWLEVAQAPDAQQSGEPADVLPRRVVFKATGERWSSRSERLAAALAGQQLG